MSSESAECKAANCQTQARNKSWIFAFSQFCQSLNILGHSVQIDQIYHLRRQFSLTLTLSNTYRCKCILIPQNDFGMQTNLVNRLRINLAPPTNTKKLTYFFCSLLTLQEQKQEQLC